MKRMKPRNALGIVGVSAFCLMASPALLAQPGKIRAALDTDANVTSAWAVRRYAKKLETSQGRTKDIGMYAERHEGTITGDAVTFTDLPVPGRYDLRFKTADGGVIQGWDTTVPPSDYVGEPPLQPEARETILKKQSDEQFTAFADRVRVLDVRGNIQNAVLLVEKLRWQPFTGGGYQPGEWVWRVERWQWENPNEQTWVPYQERPYYALVRQRLRQPAYEAKRVVYARHLGGLGLTSDGPKLDLGTIVVPRPRGGVYAVDPAGERIEPIPLKGEGQKPSG